MAVRRDKLVKKVISSIIRNLEGESETDLNNPTAKDLIGALASWGGKSKDEIVQVLCHEVGVATAAVLKEPLNQVLENRKLQITMELVPKPENEQQPPPPVKKKTPRPRKKKAAKAKRKTVSRK